MQKTKIITTVGTSVFENYLKDKTVSEHKKKDFRTDYNNLKEEAQPFNKWESCKDELDELEESITSWYHNNPNASAEIKSILKIKEQTEGEVEVHLIATDTVLSVKAAELVKEWLKENKISVEKVIKVIDGLRIEDADAFINNGIHNLIENVLDIHEANEDNNSILNISGGFKAMIPVLTIVGQLYDIPLFYIYENSDTPIELQRLPFNFDWDVIEYFSDYLAQPNRLKREDAAEAVDSMINLQLVKKVREDFQLTVIGQLLLNFLKRRPPLFDTTFGYLVEYKIKECFDKEFGCDKVLHGYKSSTKSFQGDLDLIVTDDQNMETIEIKYAELLNDEPRLSKFMTSLCERTKVAERELSKTAKNICLMIYRFKQPTDPDTAYQFSESQKQVVLNIEKQIKAEFPNSNFLVKCFYVKPNPIKSGNRILHQQFLKNSLKFNQIKTIFPIQ